MQYNHQNSTIPDVYRIAPNKLPSLIDFDSYLTIGQRVNRDFEVYFSHDGEELASTLMVGIMKHPRLIAMLKAVILAVENLNKKPNSETHMRIAQTVCNYFLEHRLTKKI